MRVLIIEDDEDLCEAVKVQLEAEGYGVDCCYDGENGLYFAIQKAHDVILLDRMLPGMDGMHLLRALRKSGVVTPVILVTALNGIGDRVDGLDSGADDYIVKPFAVEELFARLRAVLRRPRQIGDESRLACGDVELDSTGHSLKGPGGSVQLSRRECQLMETFIKNPDTVLVRQRLIASVWGVDAEVEDGNLDSYIHFLRRRLKAVGSSSTIRTVHGAGYVMEAAGCS